MSGQRTRRAAMLGRCVRGARRRDWALVVLIVVFSALLCGHRRLPDVWGVATLGETFLPWSALAVVALGLAALIIESAPAAVSLVLPIVVWAVMFAPVFGDRSQPHPPGATRLVVLSEDLDAASFDPSSTAGHLDNAGADVIALEGLTPADRAGVGDVLASRFGYSTVIGGDGLWSRYPLGPAVQVNVGEGTASTTLRASVDTPNGTVTVYVTRLVSAGLGSAGKRNAALAALRGDVVADPSPRLIVAGDLSTAATDREMRRLSAVLRDAQEAAGSGFGFTWPAQFPLARPDHILVRGFVAVSSWVLPDNGSDHRGVVAVLYS